MTAQIWRLSVQQNPSIYAWLQSIIDININGGKEVANRSGQWIRSVQINIQRVFIFSRVCDEACQYINYRQVGEWLFTKYNLVWHKAII